MVVHDQETKEQREVAKQAGLAPTQPKVAKPEAANGKEFNLVCHDMYKRFGAAFAALKPLCKTAEDTNLLVDQMHQLRTAMRALLQEAKDVP
jgi:hypothetical protein